jgi:glutathione peroxidase
VEQTAESAPAFFEVLIVTEPASRLYSFSAPLPDGRVVQLEEFRGRVLLVVNTASECGFTPQYAGLELLYRRYRERGFSVLAFPCNQFGRQEPGSDSQIAEFCERQFGVSFPVFCKIDVNGPKTHPLYAYLKSKKMGVLGFVSRGRIPWNFTKFVCGRSGEVIGRFAPSTQPERLATTIENLLDRE